MNRNFGLPLAFAAAAHGALMFGFVKSPSTHVAETRYKIIDFELHPLVPDEPVPAVSQDRDQARPEIEAPQIPRTDEPPPILAPEAVTFVAPPVAPFDRTNVAKDIAAAPMQGDGDFASHVGPIVGSEFLDKAPRTRFQAAPVYPYDAKRDGLHGDVVVEFIVDDSGHVHEPRVISSTNRVFEEPTLRAVSRWVFEPGKRGGKIVSFRMMVPVVFNLNN